MHDIKTQKYIYYNYRFKGMVVTDTRNKYKL